MSELPLLTAQDLLERTLSSANIAPSDFDRNVLHGRRAVLTAVREFPKLATWNYYIREKEFSTDAVQSDGTIEYDASTGICTLTDAEWPENVRLRRLLIDGRHYDIASGIDATQIVLGPVKPSENIIPGTTYVLYRGLYPLPIGFQSLFGVWDLSNDLRLWRRTATQEADYLVNCDDDPGEPRGYTIRNKGEIVGQSSLQLIPAPDVGRTMMIQYQTAPVPVTLFEFSTGTVSCTEGSTLATLSGGQFPPSCVGSVIRFSATSDKPTALEGGFDGELNPWVYQRVIQKRINDTTVDLDNPVGDLSGVGYTISNLIDIEYYVMADLIEAVAVYQFYKIQGSEPDVINSKKYAMLEALSEARSADGAKTRYADASDQTYFYANTPAQPEEG